MAARALGGTRAEQALSCLIALALLTSASSMILGGPRVYARMAQDGVLPRALGRLHGDYPKIAVLTQTALSLFVVWAAGLRELLEFAGVTLSLSAGAVVVGWLYQNGRSAFSWRRLLPVVAAVFFLTATVGIVIATLVMRPASAIAATILINFGLAAYAWGNRQVGTTLKRGELTCL